MNVEYYQSMTNRNVAAAQLKRDGATNVRKRSTRGCVLSPSAVVDFTGTSYPNGFGGSSAQYFGVLYIVEWGY